MVQAPGAIWVVFNQKPWADAAVTSLIPTMLGDADAGE